MAPVFERGDSFCSSWRRRKKPSFAKLDCGPTFSVRIHMKLKGEQKRVKPCPDTVCRKARLWADILIWIHVEQKGRKNIEALRRHRLSLSNCGATWQCGYMCSKRANKNIQALLRHRLSLSKIVSRHFNKETCAAKRQTKTFELCPDTVFR